MRRLIVGFVALASFVGGLQLRSAHGQWTLNKIVGTETSVPGGNGGSFTGVTNPCIDGGTVVFEASGGGQRGIYKYQSGIVTAVADRNTAIPGGSGNFYGFSTVSLDGEDVAFTGFGDGEVSATGVYTVIDGHMTMVVDKNTPIPGRDGNMTDFRSPDIKAQTVVVRGWIPGVTEGICKIDSEGSLTMVADFDTPIPGDGRTFNTLSSQPSLAGGQVIFVGGTHYRPARYGIYRETSGVFTAIYDTSTSVPGGLGQFTAFLDAGTDGTNVAFRGVDSADKQGIYTDASGSLTNVADTNTLIPEGVGNFDRFSWQVSIDDGNVAFIGLDVSDKQGLYAYFGGQLEKVVDCDDLFEGGKTLEGIQIVPESLSGRDVVFRATFTDSSESIYVATIPEPSSLILLLTGAFGLLLHTRRRR